MNASGSPCLCFRGVRKQEWVKDGVIASLAFDFDDREPKLRERQAAGRQPDAFEASINWEDGDELSSLRSLHSDEENSKYGIIYVPGKHILGVSLHTLGAFFAWERAPIANKNPFHGNLLALATSTKKQRRQLAAVIAAGLDKHLARDQVSALIETLSSLPPPPPPLPAASQEPISPVPRGLRARVIRFVSDLLQRVTK